MREKEQDRPGDLNIKKELIKPSVCISIIALIISVAFPTITIFRERTSRSENLQLERQERLATLTQQLSETREKIVGTQVTIPLLDPRHPLIEEAIILHDKLRAVELRDRVLLVNSFQKMVLAEALYETDQPYRAGPIAEEAVERAGGNPLGTILAGQVLGITYFNQEKSVEGRRAYSRALAAADVTDDPAGHVDTLIRLLHKIDIGQRWFSSELRINNCPGAKEQLLKLETYGKDGKDKDFPRTLAGREFERRVQPTRENLAKFCP